MAVIEWAANIDSFGDLSKIEFVRIDNGSPTFGLSQEADYRTPPSPITGLFTEDKKKSKPLFLKYKANIQTALAYWQSHKLLRELS